MPEAHRRSSVSAPSHPALSGFHEALVQLARHPATRGGDPRDALGRVTRLAAESLEVERASVWLLEDGARVLRCVDLYELSRDQHSDGDVVEAAAFPRYFECLHEHRFIDADDARHDPRTRELGEAYLEPLGISSLLDAAVRVGGRTVGVVCHDQVGPRRAWTPQESAFAAAIADQVALILTTSDRHSVEEALRQSEERFHTVIQEMPVMANAFDANGRIVFWNHECEKVTGYTAEEIVGNPRALELLYPDAEYRRWMVGEWAERGDNYRNWEWELVTRRGEVRRIAWSNISRLAPIPGWHTWGIGVDVTERRAAEERLELALRGAELGLWDWNIPDGTVIVDRRGAAMVGLQREEMTVAAWMERVHEEDRLRVRRRLEALTAGRFRMYEAEYRVRHASGGWLWVFDRGQVVERDARGHALRAAGTHRDITERKRTELEVRSVREQLEQQQREHRTNVYHELEAAKKQLVHSTRLATIGQVAASMAHELRNPLGAARNAAFYVRRYAGLTDPRHAEHLRIIEEGICTAATIIDNLLEITQTTEPRKLPLDLAVVVDEARCALEAPELCRIHLAFDPDPFEVLADATLLRRAFTCLLTNSVQAASGRTDVTVSAARSATEVIITLTDSGPGIPPDDRDRVFMPLYTTKAKGTGLGLTLSRQIIEQHGGKLDLVRDVQGSHSATFQILLPR